MPTRIIRKNRTTARLIRNTLPVVVVNRSNKYTSAQVFDPITGKTLFSSTSKGLTSGTKTEQAKQVGSQLAEKLKGSKIERVVFHRNGYLYHGRVAAIAEGLREQNINL